MTEDSNKNRTDELLAVEAAEFHHIMLEVEKLLADDSESYTNFVRAKEMHVLSREHLQHLADTLIDGIENNSVDDPDSVAVLIGYINAILNRSDQAQKEESNPEDVKANKRRFLAGAAAIATVGVLGATASAPSHAIGGAAETSVLLKILAQAKTAYDIAVKELKAVMDMMNGLNAINNAITQGIDGLLNIQMEENTKAVTAHVTAVDSLKAQINDHARKKTELGSKSNSGACVDDSTAAVSRALEDQIKAGGEFEGGKATTEGVVSPKGDDSAEKSESILEDIRSNNVDALSGGTLVDGSVSQDGVDKTNKEKAFERLTQQPVSLVRGRLNDVSKTAQGREIITAVVTHQTRRSHATAVLGRHKQSQQGEYLAYAEIRKNLDNTASYLTTPPVAEDGESAAVDYRQVQYAQRLKTLIDQSSTADSAGRRLMSQSQLLEFIVRSKNDGQFHEYIRSTGAEPAPLLREIISQNSASLLLQHEMLKYLKELSQLNAIANLISLDSPEQINELNSRMNRADQAASGNGTDNSKVV